MDGRVSLQLQPTRFRRDLIESNWKSTDFSLSELQVFLKSEISPTLDQERYSCCVRTLYKRDGVRYKGNPFNRSGGAWHDWAYFETETIGKTLCHILCFLDISGVDEDSECGCTLSGDAVFSDGLYALCHYLPEDPFTNNRQISIYDNHDNHYLINDNCNLVRWSCKVTSWIDRNRLPRNHRPKPTLALVPMDSLLGPAIVIPDDDQFYPHTYWCVASKNEWPAIFEGILCRHVDKESAREALGELLEEAGTDLSSVDNNSDHRHDPEEEDDDLVEEDEEEEEEMDGESISDSFC